MIRSWFSLSGETGPRAYPVLAALLVAAQYSYVWFAFATKGQDLWSKDDAILFPMWRLMKLLTVDSGAVAGGFAVCLLCSLLLGIVSFRRANWSGRWHGLALFAMVPTVQVFACAVLALMPKHVEADNAYVPIAHDKALARRQVLIGLGAGMSIIVVAVVLSANALGAYGLGLFVATPLLVGFTTGYFVNSGQRRDAGETVALVMLAGVLGTLALLMLALEGLVCILVVAPLAAVMAMVGGMIGRSLAISIHHRNRPTLALAALPLVFVLDAALPPEVPVIAQEEIVIAAPPSAVWRALTDGHRIAEPPALVGLAGFAYPIASHLTGEGVGALRVGVFSTGEARERVTVWQPGRLLAFRGLSHAPAMEEMSPYRVVHAPHVRGYFDTLDTRFVLTPVTGGTRLAVQSRHVLRIDPVAYWGPIAEWAIRQNMQRVLRDIGNHAVASR